MQENKKKSKQLVNTFSFKDLPAIYGLKSKYLNYFSPVNKYVSKSGFIESSNKNDKRKLLLWNTQNNETSLDTSGLPKSLLRHINPSKDDIKIYINLYELNHSTMNITTDDFKNFAEESYINQTSQNYLYNILFGNTDNTKNENACIINLAKNQYDILSKNLKTIEYLHQNDIRKINCDDNLINKVETLITDLYNLYYLMLKEIKLLKRINKDIQALKSSKIRLKILGIGEMSTTFTITGNPNLMHKHPDYAENTFYYAYKRLPPFPNKEEIDSYLAKYYKYHKILEEIKIALPFYSHKILKMNDGRYRLFSIQERLHEYSIGSRVINQISKKDNMLLFNLVLQNLLKIFNFNKQNKEINIGFDGQIPNWAIKEFNNEHPQIKGDETLIYIDTSTPLIQINGIEQLKAELFLETMPGFLRYIAKKLFLQDVLNRYYNPRLVIMDLIANYILYNKKELIDDLIHEANNFISGTMADYNIAPYTSKEVFKYYKGDRFIWMFLQISRRIDKFITTKILRRPYDVYLPKTLKPK